MPFELQNQELLSPVDQEPVEDHPDGSEEEEKSSVLSSETVWAVAREPASMKKLRSSRPRPALKNRLQRFIIQLVIEKSVIEKE